MFLVARTYVSVCETKDFEETEIVGETLRNCGLSLTLTSFTNVCAFVMASFIPVPALQTFSRQVRLSSGAAFSARIFRLALPLPNIQLESDVAAVLRFEYVDSI